jgi:hypothetical protein
MLFARWRKLGNLDKAMRSGFGTTLLRFEKRWKKWALVRYGWMKLVTSLTLIWILAAVLFIFVYISRRVKFRRKLDEMRKRESLDSQIQTDPWDKNHTGQEESRAEGSESETRE